MKNKFSEGRELSDKIRWQTDSQAYDPAAWKIRRQLLWQISNQTYWQITSYIIGAANEK